MKHTTQIRQVIWDCILSGLGAVRFFFFNAMPLLYDLTPREPMFLTEKERLSRREISGL